MSIHDAPVGVFGGTFNPVHYGHLRSALELAERLEFAQLRMMPCALPVHRDQPDCAAEHRAAMVELAVSDEPKLCCDPRELQRQGPSYTIDSLAEIRAELGVSRSICLVMGLDALLKLDTWHRWQELLGVAHIVAIARPGWKLPVSGIVADWIGRHRAAGPETLRREPNGSLLVEELRPLAISSTEIRGILRAGNSARYLLPESVLNYIEQHQLYC